MGSFLHRQLLIPRRLRLSLHFTRNAGTLTSLKECGDVEASRELVLQAHTGDGLEVDAIPGALTLNDDLSLGDQILVCPTHVPRQNFASGEVFKLGRISGRLTPLLRYSDQVSPVPVHDVSCCLLDYPSSGPSGIPMRERCGANRQARPRIAPDTVAIMPAALTASVPPNQSGP